MKVYLITLFIAASGLLACDSVEQHDHGAKQGHAIQLNKGEKWKINEEMKPHIQMSSDILNEYINKRNLNYQKLSEELNAQNSALIKSCTMKGESHDALHNWLHPHMDLIKSLSNAHSEDEAQEIITRLEASYQSFNEYFE